MENPQDQVRDRPADFWMTGECWGYVEGYGSYYTDGGFDSMISFKYKNGSGVPGIGSIDGAYSHAASSYNSQANYNLLTYISSHDDNLARNDLMYQGSAFLLYPGGIQIYYGDESNRPLVSGIPFDGGGGSGHALRSDMNFNPSGNDAAILAHWQKVGKFRHNHVAVGAGDHQKVSSSSRHHRCYRRFRFCIRRRLLHLGRRRHCYQRIRRHHRCCFGRQGHLHRRRGRHYPDRRSSVLHQHEHQGKLPL